jgi:hypothetical protein
LAPMPVSDAKLSQIWEPATTPSQPRRIKPRPVRAGHWNRFITLCRLVTN